MMRFIQIKNASGDHYTCFFNFQSIVQMVTSLSSKSSEHDKGKSLKDVASLLITNCYGVKAMPTELLVFLDNLTVVEVRNSGLRTITKQDMRGLEKVKELWIVDNQLKQLPGDLFNDMPHLEYVSFASNEIVQIGKNLLEPLQKLKLVDFRGNAAIDVFFTTRQSNQRKCVDLNEMNKIIRLQCNGPDSLLADDIEKLWLGSEFSDFTIKVGEVRFKVHRCFLGVASPMFAGMFRHDFAENKNSELEIADFNADAVQQFLHFIYTRSMPQDVSNAVELYKMAELYLVGDLIPIAQKMVIDNINPKNAFDVLLLGSLHNNASIKASAISKISDHMKKDPKKLKQLMEALEQILQADRLGFMNLFDDEV